MQVKINLSSEGGITMSRTEIISVGNELLSGRTLNTNAQWLCQQLFQLGIRAKRIVTVGDELDELASCIREAIGRGTSLLITTGGLGPTYDDMTLEGVAKALGLELLEHPEALKLIQEKYSKASSVGKEIVLTQARRKMATLPRGANPIPNPVGTAPAVYLEVDGRIIFCLPGVPEEMRAIFETYVRPLITSRFRGSAVAIKRAILVGIMESSLAPLIDEVRKAFPSIYIKSHPSRSELDQPLIELEVQGDEESAQGAIKALINLAEREGGKLVSEGV